MKKSNIEKNMSLSYSDLRYYQPISKTHQTQTNYQFTRSKRQEDTFRRKKTSTYHQLNYSSCLNPFARARTSRFDQPKKQYDVKKKVPFTSNASTDPVTLRFQLPQKAIRTRPQYTNSIIYACQNERKYLLPSQRQFSGVKRNYHYQLGLSYSLQKLPKTRDTLNSSRIKPMLQYAEADHIVYPITPKIGSKQFK